MILLSSGTQPHNAAAAQRLSDLIPQAQHLLDDYQNLCAQAQTLQEVEWHSSAASAYREEMQDLLTVASRAYGTELGTLIAELTHAASLLNPSG